MITANQLRIGNYVQCVGVYKDSIERAGFMQVDAEFIMLVEKDKILAVGVQINDKILEACGFVKDRTGFALPDKMSLSFSITKDGEYLPCWLDKALFPNGTRVVKYIHELQNLYFALTGSELTLKSLSPEKQK